MLGIFNRGNLDPSTPRGWTSSRHGYDNTSRFSEFTDTRTHSTELWPEDFQSPNALDRYIFNWLSHTLIGDKPVTEVYNQLSDTLGAYYKAHKNEATKSCISKSRVFSEFKKYAGAHRAHRGVSAFAEFESELQTPSSSRDQLKATRDQVPGRVSPHVEEALARRAIHNSTAAVAATLRSKIEAGRVSRPGGLFVSGEKLPSRPAPLSESPKVIPPPPVKRDPIRLSLESALSKNPVFCESEGSLKWDTDLINILMRHYDGSLDLKGQETILENYLIEKWLIDRVDDRGGFALSSIMHDETVPLGISMSTDTAIKTLQESYKRMGELISVQEIRLLQNGDIVDFGKLSTTDQSGITVRHFRIIQIQSITEEGGDFVIQCIANCVYDQRKKTYLAKDTPLTIRAPGRKLNITGDLRVFHDDKDHTGSFFTAKIGKMSVLPIDGTSAFWGFLSSGRMKKVS